MGEKIAKAKENFDPVAYARSCNLKIKKNGKWLNLTNENCPNCYTEGKGGINYESLVFHCRVCGASYDAISWIRERESCNFGIAIDILEKYSW